MHLKISSEKWRPFCLGLNVLIQKIRYCMQSHYLNNPWQARPEILLFDWVYSWESTFPIGSYICLGSKETFWHRVSRQLISNVETLEPGSLFNIKMSSYQYRESRCWDKTVLRSSYLHNGNYYTGKTASLFWINAPSVVILTKVSTLVATEVVMLTNFRVSV